MKFSLNFFPSFRSANSTTADYYDQRLRLAERADNRFACMDAHGLRLELEALYANCAACLNEERFENWPEFFVARRDRIAIEQDRLRFKERTCVFDSMFVPNNLVFPL